MIKKTKHPKPEKSITTWSSAWQPLSYGDATISWQGAWGRAHSLSPRLHGPLFLSLMAHPMPEGIFFLTMINALLQKSKTASQFHEFAKSLQVKITS